MALKLIPKHFSEEAHSGSSDEATPVAKQGGRCLVVVSFRPEALDFAKQVGSSGK